MKKLIFILCVLGLIAAAPLGLTRVTVMNKSGYAAVITLDGFSSEQFVIESPNPIYNLPIAVGTKEVPAQSVWTILPGMYDVTVVYMENGIEIYRYTERLSFERKSKIALLAPRKSGVELCNERYEEPELNECLKSLTGIKPSDNNNYKYLPTMWLAKLKY